MDITIDEAEPEDSINRYAMDTRSTGEEVLDIPPHWHKVSQGMTRKCYVQLLTMHHLFRTTQSI